jgi:rhamnose transport system substrate-binding protein
MNKKVANKASAVLFASVLALGLAGCSPAVEETPAAEVSSAPASLKIAIVPKAINIGYFTAWDEGAQKACVELKAICDYIGPNEITGAAQVEFINQVIQQQYDILVISAADQNAIVPSLQKAKDAGIIIVTSDADVAAESKDSRVVSILPSEENRIGTAQVDWMAEAIGSTGSVAIISPANAANQTAWINAMGPYLESQYPEMSWVGGSLEKAVFYANDPTESSEAFAAILAQYPDVAGIISPTTVGVLAAAVEKKAKKAAVKVTGLGLPSEMASYIEDGTVEKVGLWNPLDLGYVAVYAGVAAKNGTFDGAVGSSFMAGDKSYTVVEGNIAYLGDPYTFTKENIAEFKVIY